VSEYISGYDVCSICFWQKKIWPLRGGEGGGASDVVF
jgi:hypothetical protein